MVENDQPNKISFLGEVISIYEQDGKSFAKIHYHPGYVDVTLQESHEIFLGDKVVVDSKLQIKKILVQPDDN